MAGVRDFEIRLDEEINFTPAGITLA